MNMPSAIEWIDRNRLCLGCGFCESLCGKENVSMQIGADGFFHPNVIRRQPEKESIVLRVCPGLNVVNDIRFAKNERIWGRILSLHAGFATNAAVRRKGSSGGVVSGLAIHLLDTGQVDAVLQVGGDRDDYHRNSLRVSVNRDDILRCASSRYAPALVFDRILQLLETTSHRFCFIGKPCDISGLKNLLTVYPQYRSRFVVTVAILCAGMPSFRGTQAIVDQLGAVPPVSDLTYRGNGWPGYFSFIDSRQRTYRQSYNDSWGKNLNQHLHFRCKLCPEGIGIQADIAAGDAWETTDGYPDFAERDGQSLVIGRTATGEALLEAAAADGALALAPLAVEQLRMMQPYQYNRRTRAFSRKLAMWLGSGIRLNFRHLRLFSAMLMADKLLLLKDFKGTLRRVRARKTQLP